MNHKVSVTKYDMENRKRELAVGQVKTKVRAAKTMVLQKDLAQQTNDSK